MNETSGLETPQRVCFVALSVVPRSSSFRGPSRASGGRTRGKEDDKILFGFVEFRVMAHHSIAVRALFLCSLIRRRRVFLFYFYFFYYSSILYTAVSEADDTTIYRTAAVVF